MKSRTAVLAIGLMLLTCLGEVFAAQGNNNALRPAIFPPSPVEPPPIVPTQFDIIGYIQMATVDASVCPEQINLDPRLSGGRVTVNGIEIIIPCHTILQMPATSLTWAELFDSTLVPDGTPQDASGLALADRVATPALPLPAYEIHVVGNIVKDPVSGSAKHIAGLVFISQQGLNLGQGYVRSIDYATGELCVAAGLPNGGLQPQTSASPTCQPPDARVRINDPVGRFGKRHGGPGCLSDGSCDVEETQYDRRFTADTDNPTIHASTGYPMCVPRAYPFGTDGDTDALCPQQNRPKQAGAQKCSNLPAANGITFPAFPAQSDGYCDNFVMEPLALNPPPPAGPCGTVIDPFTNATVTIPCSTRPDRQAPFEIGDYIDYAGTLLVDGNADSHASPYYISAHTINAHLGIYTYPGSKPVYVMVESLLAGTGGLAIKNIPQEVTSRLRVEGFTTDPSAIVDIFAMDVDKNSGVVTDRLLANVNPSGPPVIGRARFVPAAGNYAPPTRNVRIVSRSLCETNSQPCFVPQQYFDPAGVEGKFANGLVAGQYNAPNFEFIFAENLFLGGPVLPNNFQDLPFLACGSGPLTTATAGNDAPLVGPLDPPPWAAPMPAPTQCAGKLANQLSIPATQTPDTVTVLNAAWNNAANKGKLTVTATSSLPNNTQNLQLYVQATDFFGVPMAAEPQPMQLVSNGATTPCPAASNPCWQYATTGTIMDPQNSAGDPFQTNSLYHIPTTVTVFSSRGGVGTLVPTIRCGLVNGTSTCSFP